MKMTGIGMRYLMIAVAMCGLAWTMACGGASTGVKSEEAAPSAVLRGVFLDGPVGGLTYATPTLKGVTKADGVFEYRAGETVTFAIGDIVLGKASGKDVITPLDIVPEAKDVKDQRVVNICVVLQTLDDDGNPENGIVISEKVASMVSLYGKEMNFNKPVRAFSFDGGLRGAMAELNNADAFGDMPRAVRPPGVAQKHLEATLSRLKEKK